MVEKETYWKKIIGFNDKYFPLWKKQNPIFLSNALAGEVGEVCNSVKHLIGGGTHLEPKNYIKEILEELTDVEHYKIMLLESLGISEIEFINAVFEKIEKNKVRMNGKLVY